MRGSRVFSNPVTIMVSGDGKFNYYSSENNALLCLFSHVWKMQVEQKCTSTYCLNNTAVVIWFQTTFSVPSSSSS